MKNVDLHRKFFEEYVVEKKTTNVLFCIYKTRQIGEDLETKRQEEKDNYLDAREYQVNGFLEYIQEILKKEQKEELEINKAFVFFDGITCAKDFQEVNQKKIYYADYGEEKERLDHLWFMGMALLEKKAQEDAEKGKISKNYLVLITNAAFSRTDTEKILAADRFKNLEYMPVLVKSERAGGGELETYIANKGRVIQAKSLKDKMSDL